MAMPTVPMYLQTLNKGQNKNKQDCGIIVKGHPPDLKVKTPFYSLQWFYSGSSDFYPLYVCQAEVFHQWLGEDMKSMRIELKE